MIYHVLNGDTSSEPFAASKLEGEVIVCREALIEGDLQGDNLEAFWKHRAAFTESAYGNKSDDYKHRCLAEFHSILQSQPGSVFNLWFGYDLFCQVNLWFILSLINELPGTREVYIVYPTYLPPESPWLDFGQATEADLKDSLTHRTRCHATDAWLGAQLWRAYKAGDVHLLARLGQSFSKCFPNLADVVQAHLDRYPKKGEKTGRPERILAAIMNETKGSFEEVFQAFTEKEGIYGFGDAQLRPIFEKIQANPDLF